MLTARGSEVSTVAATGAAEGWVSAGTLGGPDDGRGTARCSELLVYYLGPRQPHIQAILRLDVTRDKVVAFLATTPV